MHKNTSAPVVAALRSVADARITTSEAMRVIREKFVEAQGALKLSVDKVAELASPEGSTVAANAHFEGKIPIKVRHVPTCREGRIVSRPGRSIRTWLWRSLSGRPEPCRGVPFVACRRLSL